MNVLIWAFWVLFFVVFEGYALYRHISRDTFSWEVWSLERRFPVLKWLIAGGLIWLIAHFFFGG